MAEISAISWTDATFNPWIGCTKVSTGPQGACVNCFAERDNKRRGWVPGWGPGVPRRRTKTWGAPVLWNRKAAEPGYRTRDWPRDVTPEIRDEVLAELDRMVADPTNEILHDIIAEKAQEIRTGKGWVDWGDTECVACGREPCPTPEACA